MAVQTAQTYERAIFLTAVSAKDAVSETRPAERFLRTTWNIEQLYCGVPRARRLEISSQQTMLYQHGIRESVLRANTWFSFYRNSDLENQAQVIKLFCLLFYSKE